MRRKLVEITKLVVNPSTTKSGTISITGRARAAAMDDSTNTKLAYAEIERSAWGLAVQRVDEAMLELKLAGYEYDEEVGGWVRLAATFTYGMATLVPTP